MLSHSFLPREARAMPIRRHAAAETKVEQQMTAMIDVVFQLLTFFVMSFKVASIEGDFSVKMPLARVEPSQSQHEVELPPLKLRLQAAADGSLLAMSLNQHSLPCEQWSVLREHVMHIVQNADHAELEIDSDYGLRYEYVIAAMDAVTGYPAGDHQVVKLIDEIRFTSPAKLRAN
jgi:biopolymer transport protein ExbD